MKKGFILSAVFVLGLLLPQTVAEQVTQPVGTFENYVGVTQWRVDVTEDERSCGGGITTKSYAVQIQHNQKIADIGDWGHGMMRGTLTGDTLSLPGRTIPDGSGSSTLSAFDIKFSLNCSRLAGKYNWAYSDSYSKCKGSTTLTGTRVGGGGCPAAEQETEDTQTTPVTAPVTTVASTTTQATTTEATTTTTMSDDLNKPPGDLNIEQLEAYPDYSNEKDYCGPENNQLVMSLIPRGPPLSGADFNSACYNHDKCYAQCVRTQNAKEFCDQEFGGQMRQACQTKSRTPENNCMEQAWYNPFRYTCITAKAIGDMYCVGSSYMYQGAVATFANCFNAYPCYVDKHPLIPCI